MAQVKPAALSPSAALPMAARELLALLETFGRLLQQETEALQRGDFAGVDALQADKKHLAGQYQEKVSHFSAHKETLSALDPALREKLTDAREDFSRSLSENTRALELAQNSARRLVDRILDAARDAVVDETKTQYSASGRFSTYRSATASLTVDEAT